MCDEYYTNGIKSGPRICYYPSGFKQQTSPYLNGKIQGWLFDFDSSGGLSQKAFFLDRKQVGDNFFYHPSGNIGQYYFLDFDAIAKVSIFYNENGYPIDSVGTLVYYDSLYYNDTIRYGNRYADSAYIGILLSHPPYMSTSIYINECDSLNTIFNVDKLDSTLPYIYFVRKIPHELTKMQIIGKQYDSISHHTRTQLHEILF